MSTLASKLIAKAQRAIVAHYHLCTNDDDWGTCDEHWLQVASDNPAVGYINRWFVRVKNTRRFKIQKNRTDLTFHRRGVMCVTFLRGEITDVGWHIKPSGRHAHPRENYQHRDDEARAIERAAKPAGYGAWE
ncbi:hypothetical protein phiK7B1_120 [Pseudomonas phage phiK7B1]|nr:hypothetical protein phiK7B1_120 [Pseudomonas phage phiK7B1]